MAKVYKAGQVAAALFSKKNSKSSNSDLSDLFSGTRLPAGGLEVPESSPIVKEKKAVKRVHEKPAAEISTVVKKKKKKKKDQEKEKTESDEFPFQHESLIKKEKQDKEIQSKKKKTKKDLEKEDETSEKRPRRNRKRDKAADKRTIFVGNCPLSADKKVLKALFKDYGEIETIRFRCAPAADPNLPRRAIVITKNFNDKCKSYIAYVVFKEEEAAKKALEKNGHVLDDLHLRVDIASASSKADKKRSVFIGNLPFDVQEDEIRDHFTDCGDITNVRIVRDRQTSLGKGIAYVSFESKDSVGLSLKLNGSQFQNRKIRVMGCTNKAKDKDSKQQKEKKKDSQKKSNSQSNQDPDKKRLSFAPSNVTTSKFKTILQTKKEKRLRKMKKKASGKKTDAITAILGEAPSTPKQMKTSKKSGPKKGGAGVSFKKGPKTFKGKGGKNKITNRSKTFKQNKNFGRKK